VINNVNCIRVGLDELEYRVIDKCAVVIFFGNVNTNKANSSPKMDYKVRSHGLGNFPRSYYYVKKVLQVVRLIINIRNKVHIILMQRDAWYMRGVSYAILTLGNSCSVLPSLETFNGTTTEKSIRLFTDVAINEVAWYVIKQKKMTQQNSCTTQPKQIFTVLLITRPFEDCCLLGCSTV
jgi:hypothetical protein